MYSERLSHNNNKKRYFPGIPLKVVQVHWDIYCKVFFSTAFIAKLIITFFLIRICTYLFLYLLNPTNLIHSKKKTKKKNKTSATMISKFENK